MRQAAKDSLRHDTDWTFVFVYLQYADSPIFLGLIRIHPQSLTIRL